MYMVTPTNPPNFDVKFQCNKRSFFRFLDKFHLNDKKGRLVLCHNQHEIALVTVTGRSSGSNHFNIVLEWSESIQKSYGMTQPSQTLPCIHHNKGYDYLHWSDKELFDWRVIRWIPYKKEDKPVSVKNNKRSIVSIQHKDAESLTYADVKEGDYFYDSEDTLFIESAEGAVDVSDGECVCIDASEKVRIVDVEIHVK